MLMFGEGSGSGGHTTSRLGIGGGFLLLLKTRAYACLFQGFFAKAM